MVLCADATKYSKGEIIRNTPCSLNELFGNIMEIKGIQDRNEDFSNIDVHKHVN